MPYATATMRLVTWNVNGVRAVFRHGFLAWMEEFDPDVVCLQETKTGTEDLPDEILRPLGRYSYWHSGERKGYSGVATYCREEPLWVLEGMGVPEFDLEGRVLTTEFSDFCLVNAYFPNSGAGQERLEFKLWFCEQIQKFVRNLRRNRGKPVILCGDFNVAHRDIDIHSPQLNAHQSGFLPEEREWMDGFLASGYRDLFREGCPDPGHYSWWSYTPGERQRNLGWRIDYFAASPDLEGVQRCYMQPEVLGSDHCPVVLDLC